MRALWTVTASLAISVCLGACGGGTTPVLNQTKPPAPIPYTATAPGFTLSVWVKAPTSTMKPDSIVQYDLKAKLIKTFTVPGHVDGLMARSDTNELWAMANEDGNPELTIINLATGTQKTLQATVNPCRWARAYLLAIKTPGTLKTARILALRIPSPPWWRL